MLFDRRELVTETTKKVIKINRSMYCKKFWYILITSRFSEEKWLSTHANCSMLSAKIYRKLNRLEVLVSLKINNGLKQISGKKTSFKTNLESTSGFCWNVRIYPSPFLIDKASVSW